MTSVDSPQVNSQIQLRPDLQWVQRTIRGQGRWIVRDPLTTEFYYFSDREKSFLDQLDGHRNTDQWMRQESTEEGFSLVWKRKLLEQAARCNLLVGHLPGRGRQLAQQRRAMRDRSRRMLAFQTLSIRVPLFDPTALLKRSTVIARLLFSKTALWMLAVAAAGLLLILIGRWESVSQRAPGLQAMLAGDRVLALFVAYLVMKVVHESSHALACRRWGAECHEIGVLFLAFTPCLYCDVSDVWKLPQKLPRVMVAAAGIFAELAMAIAAGFVWFFTVDGPLNLIAFNVMLLGSVSTFLVNANPLLRYDGYYMLADAMDVPNLSDQSREAFWAPLKRWLSGGRLQAMPLDASFSFLVGYAITSSIYRWIVLVLILWGLNQVMAAWGLELIGGILTATIVTGVILSIIARTRAGLAQVLASGPLRWARFLVLTALVIGSLVAAFQLPIKHSIAAVGYAKPVSLEPLFTKRAGFLQEIRPTNSKVVPGDPIASMRSPEDEYRTAIGAVELEELELELRGLKSRVNDEPELSASIAVLQESIVEKRKQLDSIRRESTLLTVVARTSGTLIEPIWNTEPADPNLRLAGWRGNPLDHENLDSWMEQGTLLGWVADLSSWEIEAFVGESDLLEIHVGAAARIRLDQRPNHELRGVVSRIDSQPLTEVPHSFRGDSRLAARSDGRQSLIPEETTYRVTIEFDPSIQGMLTSFASHESLAAVRIESMPKTCYERFVRYFTRTFRFDAI